MRDQLVEVQALVQVPGSSIKITDARTSSSVQPDISGDSISKIVDKGKAIDIPSPSTPVENTSIFRFKNWYDAINEITAEVFRVREINRGNILPNLDDDSVTVTGDRTPKPLLDKGDVTPRALTPSISTERVTKNVTFDVPEASTSTVTSAPIISRVEPEVKVESVLPEVKEILSPKSDSSAETLVKTPEFTEIKPGFTDVSLSNLYENLTADSLFSENKEKYNFFSTLFAFSSSEASMEKQLDNFIS